MKTVKKILLTLSIAAAIMLLTQFLQAQDIGQGFKNKTASQRAQYQTMLMQSRLKLDSGQAIRVKAINLRYSQKFAALLKSDDSRVTRMRDAMALQKAKDKELKNVFTVDQYKQYEAVENELIQKFSGSASLLN